MNWSETRTLRTLRCCKSIGAVPHPACGADCCYESAAPSRLIPFKFDYEFVTRCGVIQIRVQAREIRLGNGLPYRQCYKSCGCDEHLCHYMAAPPPSPRLIVVLGMAVGVGRCHDVSASLKCVPGPVRGSSWQVQVGNSMTVTVTASSSWQFHDSRPAHRPAPSFSAHNKTFDVFKQF